MKKTIKLLSILFLFGAIFMSCEGPAGIDGVDGVDGEDGTVTCLVCHSTETQTQIGYDFAASQHFAGEFVEEEGGSTSCGRCHGHEGYVEWAATGGIANSITAPTAFKCITCHSIHDVFTEDDYAFRAGDAVLSIIDGATMFADAGNNNTCINCHQSRKLASYYDKYTVATLTSEQKLANASTEDYDFYKALNDAGNLNLGATGSVTKDNGVDTFFVKFDIPTTDVFISSSHTGPHYGTQGNTWNGISAAGIADGTVYAPHSGGCVTCHMGEASGHSFKPELENCTTSSCHTTAPETAMGVIEDRIEAVGLALEAAHAVHYSDEDKAFHPVLNVVSRDIFNAFWDFYIVLNDRSNSAHNPTYVKAVLVKCEDTLGI